MNDRIARLIDEVKRTDIFPPKVTVEYDSFDENLPEPMRIAKRLTEYMAAQVPAIGDDDELVGRMKFDGSVPADIFTRSGHPGIRIALQRYYNQPQENLCTMEWQHSNMDFGRLIRGGLDAFRIGIRDARPRHFGNQEKLNFLAALDSVIRGIFERALLLAEACREAARKCEDSRRRETLLRMAGNCAQVPMHPARNFEEAVQCVYFCFPFLPDSIGRPDQYLLPFYRQGIADGSITVEHARELLQELFVMIHGWTPPTSRNAPFSAESHFVVGGYTVEHEDGFNELSRLIVESLLECDLIRPQVSLRWNAKTPREVLRFMLDCERKDKNRRIAFVNDEPRIRALMTIDKRSWEDAFDYIMVGCNEPAFQGGISLGGNTINILHPLLSTLNRRRADIVECATYEEFYAIFEEELFRSLELVLDYSNRFNMLRARDCNVLSSLFLDGCIERAAGVNRNGARKSRYCANMMGSTNLIDSLSIIRQYVFEERKVTLAELCAALDADWRGYEALRTDILKNGKFFGNNDDFSNATAHAFYRSVWKFAEGRTDLNGNALNYGNLTGYNIHFARYGALTPATPDGRVAGSALLFGSGQSDGRDHDGLTSHLLAVAHMDPTGVMCGNSILNITIDEATIQNPEGFERLVSAVETYFREGGLHLQFSHVSREELLAARKEPQKYKSLRVRVSGFSAPFVDLAEAIQENVIARTEAQP